MFRIWRPVSVVRIARLFFSVAVVGLSWLTFAVTPVAAREHSVFGIHLMHLGELEQANQLLNPKPNEEWNYLTVPLTLADLDKPDQWQSFFDQARQQRMIPVVRLMTRFENGAWTVPTKKEVTQYFTFLSQLDWPTDQRHVIIFNEVNHAKEWGGRIDPEAYAAILRFSSDWARTEGKNYRLLPAAMDLAAPNGPVTREAFSYLQAMLTADPQIFETFDYWNSHSYPNPAFSSSPTRTGQNSMRGFTHELAFAKEKTGRDFQVFITETGWEENRGTSRWLSSYYQYTVDHIWSDQRVVAVTPFVLQGDPGPFAAFSFLNRLGQPTTQYRAYQQVIRRDLEQALAERPAN